MTYPRIHALVFATCAAALVTSSCSTTKATTRSGAEPVAKPTDPATLPEAACHVRLPSYGGNGVAVGSMAYDPTPRLVVTPDGAQLDHLPIRVDELELALEARAARLEESRAGRAARLSRYLTYIGSVAARWDQLELRVFDESSANALFDGLRANLPAGFEVRPVSMGISSASLSLEHADLDALRAFMEDHVEPAHLIGYERVLRPHDPDLGDTWRAHYLRPEVAFEGSSGDAPQLESDLDAELATLSLSIRERERIDALTELTANNVGRRIAVMSGDEILLTTIAWEYIDDGDVLLTFEPTLKKAMMSKPTSASNFDATPHAFRVAFDERLSLAEVRAHLARARVALPTGSPAVALKTKPFNPIDHMDDPELAALAAKAFGSEEEPAPPDDTIPDTCPEAMALGDTLTMMFPSERLRQWTGAQRDAIEQACTCPNADQVIPFVTATPAFSLRPLMLITLTERLPEGEYARRDVPPEATWGEAVAAVAPGECLNLGTPDTPMLFCATR